MNGAAPWLIAIVGAYLLGSIPVGLLLARSKGVNLREVGSGNIGATNAMRALGKKLGLLCFALDVGKGLVPTALAGALLVGEPMTSAVAWWWLGVAAAAIAGHMFPVWLRFKGGKGVATGLGALLGVWPFLTIPAAFAAALWFVSLKVTKYVGVSSCVAAVAIPPAAWLQLALGNAGTIDLWQGSAPMAPFLVATGLLASFVLYKHRGNLARTLAGAEPRVGRQHDPDPKASSSENSA